MANVPKIISPATAASAADIKKKIDEHFGGVEGTNMVKSFKLRKKLLVLDFRDTPSAPPNPIKRTR